MPRRALVLVVLAVGCGPKDTTLATPDAEELIDSPPFVFPDAPPRADARTADAKVNPPDAKPGTPDAPPPIDAAAGMPDAPPPIDAPPATPDAPPGTPDAPATGGLRPCVGCDTASVRVLDFQQFGPDSGTKVCIFGDDADPRPYAVLAGTGHSVTETSYSVPATYDVVPAGIALRMQVILVNQAPDTTTTDCSRALADPWSTLTSASYYTIARTDINNDFSDCDSGTGATCTYFPRWDPTHTNTLCALSWTYLILDGDFGSPFGWRVINLTSNAADVSYATTNVFDESLNLDLAPTTGAGTYQARDPNATGLIICPEYVEQCLVPPLAADAATADIDACVAGDTKWILNQLTTSRIATDSINTTYYIVGDAKKLAQDETMLESTLDVTIVEAHDIIE